MSTQRIVTTETIKDGARVLVNGKHKGQVIEDGYGWIGLRSSGVSQTFELFTEAVRYVAAKDVTNWGSDITKPLYASKPQRKIPGTDMVAVTMYAAGSGNGSVRHYSIFDGDGSYLGRASNHGRRLAQSAGYHLGHGVFEVGRMDSFRNLTEVAVYLRDNKEA